MLFYVNIFISTEDAIARKLLLFKIKFILIFNLLIILIWRTYKHIKLSYYLKCRKNTESKNSKVVKTINGRIMRLSKFAVCDSKKPRFIKEQEPRGLLSSLVIKTLLNKILLVGPLSFWRY